MERGGGAAGEPLVGDRLAAALEDAAREFWLEVSVRCLTRHPRHASLHAAPLAQEWLRNNPCPDPGIAIRARPSLSPGSSEVSCGRRSQRKTESRLAPTAGVVLSSKQSHPVPFYCRAARVLRHEVVHDHHRVRVHLNLRLRRARHPWTVYALLRVAVHRLWALHKVPPQK